MLVRLFCVYLVITTLQSLSFVVPSLFQFLFHSGAEGGFIELLGSGGFWLTATAILIPAFCAYWLWQNPDRVLPEYTSEHQANVGAGELMLIGVSLLGLYLLIWGLLSLVRVEAGMARVNIIDSHDRIAQRIPYIAQIMIAIPMLMGRRRISGWLVKAKLIDTEIKENN